MKENPAAPSQFTSQLPSCKPKHAQSSENVCQLFKNFDLIKPYIR